MNGLKNLYQSELLEHARNPKNYGLKGYKLKKTLYNPSCSDEVTVDVAIKDGVINDIGYTAAGCVILKASASVMSMLLKGKTVACARKIIQNFKAMIDGKNYRDELLGDAKMFKEVKNFPARKTCALLAYMAIEEIIKNE